LFSTDDDDDDAVMSRIYLTELSHQILFLIGHDHVLYIPGAIEYCRTTQLIDYTYYCKIHDFY
jgi:hypothetical protein